MADLEVIQGGPALSTSPAALGGRSDDDLMLLARGGVESAFTELTRRHRTRALKVAYRHVGTTHVADDVVQDAFLELHRSLERYRPEGKFVPFLLRIVLNRARMVKRSWLRARLVLRQVPEPAKDAVVEARILEAERQREVQRAIDALPERFRGVIVLRFAGELSHAEVAETLRIPVGTVKSRMFKALAILRRKLDGVQFE